MNNSLKTILLSALLFLIFVTNFALANNTEQAIERPNIVLVLFDDVGFMGLGSYGSDAKTPNIDQIAQQGVQFTRFYTSSMCGPSRAMLMTGQDSHQASMPVIVEALSPEMENHPSYSLVWSDKQQTLASRLKDNGYQTYVSGKWGIGKSGQNLPHRFGFERSFVLDATGASNYQEKPYLMLYDEVKWFEDGKRTHLPDDFYSSRNLVDKLINFIDQGDDNKPFLAYLSLQAIHMPVQVPKQYVDNYNGVFDQGWDIMREQRLSKAIALGLVPSSTTLADVPDSHRKWQALTAEEKAYWARAMQVNAGMTEAADHHIGRLMAYLKAQGKLDNTLVIITSDNGAENNTIGFKTGITGMAEQRWLSANNWHINKDTLGERNNLGTIGAEWASVASSPFSLYKFNSSEGGQRVPFIIAGKAVKALGLQTGRAHITDIVPTLLDIAKVDYQVDEFYGRSQLPVLTGQSHDVWNNDSFAIEVSGNSAVYQNNWKIVRVKSPLGDEQWHLYDVVNDPSETKDLATAQAVIFQEMLNEYQAYANNVGIVELPMGENAVQLVRKNVIRKLFKENTLPLACVLLFVIVLITLLIRRYRIRKNKQRQHIESK